ncbi:MAG: RNA polymerase sigma factor [Phycisphaerae bacterium]|jgi:RNA polymerase sigma-70 factor (ECF subfamily)
MLEDKLLVLRFKRGSQDALRRIYEKHRDFLLRLAVGLLYDAAAAEDVVHNVFLRFTQTPEKISLHGNLKAFLRTCVINSARDELRRAKVRPAVGLPQVDVGSEAIPPDRWLMLNERSARLLAALEQVAAEQREVVVLRLHGEMTFRQIARLHGQPLETVRSRYRYGLEKLRSILNGEML